MATISLPITKYSGDCPTGDSWLEIVQLKMVVGYIEGASWSVILALLQLSRQALSPFPSLCKPCHFSFLFVSCLSGNRINPTSGERHTTSSTLRSEVLLGRCRSSLLIQKRSMAPTRKSRSVNKRISNSNDLSPEKDGINSNKSKQRKKKLTDKLGSQWSKEELERFYEAYRKYGKDWKKVAAVVRNRSAEMVEALYNMNRAYLSLPEGTASVIGLIAMMTDHYNVLEGSDSERESNDAPGSQKPLKRKREKVQMSVSKDPAPSQSIAPNDGCLSLLKKRRFDGNIHCGSLPLCFSGEPCLLFPQITYILPG
ncbi:hypothetical protein VNO77_13617 [Canavalia gladiata]|uniref:SANT domain-containing protein n=1 Tax=Canavalia gladiata TaxID=3824 RepID=A0AAN9QQM3_CANGL